MKCLIFHSDEITFIQGDPSDRPTNIVPVPEHADGITHRRVAVAFTCVVSNDTSHDVARTAQALSEYSRMVGRPILLVPFVHLDSFPAEDPLARTLLQQLYTICRQKGILAGFSSYGYHKSIIAKWTTLAHQGSVAFRDSKHRNRATMEARK